MNWALSVRNGLTYLFNILNSTLTFCIWHQWKEQAKYWLGIGCFLPDILFYVFVIFAAGWNIFSRWFLHRLFPLYSFSSLNNTEGSSLLCTYLTNCLLLWIISSLKCVDRFLINFSFKQCFFLFYYTGSAIKNEVVFLAETRSFVWKIDCFVMFCWYK